MSQVALELEMYGRGKERAANRIEYNEREGKASMNPYAQAIYRRFVLPLADLIIEGLRCANKPGRRAAHVNYLLPIDPEAVAYLTVRGVLTALLGGGDQDEASVARNLMRNIGRDVYHEYMLGVFEHAEPALFFSLVNDFERRHTGQDHKLTVFKMQARAAGVDWIEWDLAARDQVGGFLIEQLEQLGMLETYRETRVVNRKPRETVRVLLAPSVAELVSDITDFIVETTPYVLPCIERPRDWVSFDDGGWHTPEMRRMQPYCVRGGFDKDVFEQADMSLTLQCLNHLQSTAWRISPKMHKAVKDIARHMDIDEIIGQAEIPRPQKPGFLEHVEKENMTTDQLEVFRLWRYSMAEWHTEMRLRGTKMGRFIMATRVSDKFLEYPELFFVYNADFRGRYYPQTTGVSPQGSDLQKSLLELAHGDPLDTPEAELSFLVAGANRFGFDKAPLKDRAQWVRDRDAMLLRMADDPISYREWTEADAPLQFLAWVFEYAEWRANPSTFVNRVPVGMDGSCNGLQNFSAMLRDELGGRATNLLPSDRPNDIYKMVSDVTSEAISSNQVAEKDQLVRDLWLRHGLNRTIVKRSVMTLPYGSTRYSSAIFIDEDYLRKKKAPEFAPEQYKHAANFLSHHVWDGIGKVVVKAREAMVFLQKASDAIIKAGHPVGWTSPSGFPVRQTYFESIEHRVRTKLCGNAVIRVKKSTGVPHKRRNRNGIAPNFIHSMDAAHLTFTVLEAKRRGINSLAMIHDDYGTTAKHAAELGRIIREVFVRMYSEHDPLADFSANYPDVDLGAIPSRGSLDLSQVLQSEYFFS